MQRYVWLRRGVMVIAAVLLVQGLVMSGRGTHATASVPSPVITQDVVLAQAADPAIPPPRNSDRFEPKANEFDPEDNPPPPPRRGRGEDEEDGSHGPFVPNRRPGGDTRRRRPDGPPDFDGPPRDPNRPLPKHEHLRRAARELERAGLKEQAEKLNKDADAAEEQFRKENPSLEGGGMQNLMKTVGEMKHDIQTLRKQVEELQGELKKLKEASASPQRS